MPPSKKIFLGASAIITGVLCQMILSFRVTREILFPDVESGGGPTGGEGLGRWLEKMQEQSSIGFNALTLSYLFLIVGAVILIVGIYQNARATERLQDILSKRSSGPKRDS